MDSPFKRVIHLFSIHPSLPFIRKKGESSFRETHLPFKKGENGDWPIERWLKDRQIQFSQGFVSEKRVLNINNRKNPCLIPGITLSFFCYSILNLVPRTKCMDSKMFRAKKKGFWIGINTQHMMNNFFSFKCSFIYYPY